MTNLIALNTFRAINDLAPFADFRKARHAAMLEQFEIEYADASEFIISEIEDDAPDALLIDEVTGETMRESEFVAEQEAAAADAEVQEIAKADKLPSYKQVANYGSSRVESPVAFVHGFLNANPEMTRKQAVVALVKVHGINYSTARTQYQKWFSKAKA